MPEKAGPRLALKSVWARLRIWLDAGNIGLPAGLQRALNAGWTPEMHGWTLANSRVAGPQSPAAANKTSANPAGASSGMMMTCRMRRVAMLSGFVCVMACMFIW